MPPKKNISRFSTKNIKKEIEDPRSRGAKSGQKKQRAHHPQPARSGQKSRPKGRDQQRPDRPRHDRQRPAQSRPSQRRRRPRPMPPSKPKPSPQSRPRPTGRYSPKPIESNDKSPAKTLRIIPLGGFEEIGRNMMIFEYGKDSIIIDMGLEFPSDDMPGIDYIIPNIEYLKDKIQNIRGVLITHGHFDHIGAIPHLIDKLGNPTIYATPLTAAVIKRRQEDFPNTQKLDIEHISETSTIKLGVFKIRFFPVEHNIPEGVGMEIETPVGIVVHPGEFKFNYDRNYKVVGVDGFRELGKKNVRLLMLDSTNVEEPGRSIPEWEAEKNIEKLLREAKGRVIISTFASLLDRLAQIVNIADKLGRKVAITGRSMEANFAIAKELGLIKIKKGTTISIKEIDGYNDRKVLIITTGAQGEEFAGLSRMAARTHRDVKIKKGDTIIFSSSIVPGNEASVQILRDSLARQGVILYHYKHLNIHSGGHAKRVELKDTMEMIRPQCFMPIHGHFYMRTVNAQVAEETGIKPENIVVGDNGQVIELTKDKIRLLSETVPTSYIMVDGLGVGDIGTVVIRDRQQLAKDGMFVVITVINSKNGRVIGNPDIISRGFVYLRESKDLLREVRKRVKRIVEDATTGNHPINEMYVKGEIRKKIGKFLFQKTERSPMILPVIIEV